MVATWAKILTFKLVCIRRKSDIGMSLGPYKVSKKLDGGNSFPFEKRQVPFKKFGDRSPPKTKRRTLVRIVLTPWR